MQWCCLTDCVRGVMTVSFVSSVCVNLSCFCECRSSSPAPDGQLSLCRSLSMCVALVVVFQTDVLLWLQCVRSRRPNSGNVPLADMEVIDSESISFDESAEKLEKTDRPRARERFRSSQACVWVCLERNCEVFEWNPEPRVKYDADQGVVLVCECKYGGSKPEVLKVSLSKFTYNIAQGFLHWKELQIHFSWSFSILTILTIELFSRDVNLSANPED